MNKQLIASQIVADSLNATGNSRLTSFLVTFPAIVLPDILLHRAFSRCISNVRAIPVESMIKSVEENPFIPLVWQRHHSGIQGDFYLTQKEDIDFAEEQWKKSLRASLLQARILEERAGITKQLCNRLLEPFMWTNMLITADREGLENFFELRCPRYEIFLNGTPHYFHSKREVFKVSPEKEYWEWDEFDWLKINKGQSEIHLMMLAEKMFDEFERSRPEKLACGDWHIPFHSKIEDKTVMSMLPEEIASVSLTKALNRQKIKISAAMAYRTSFTKIPGSDSYLELVNKHDELLKVFPLRTSSFEHCAVSRQDDEKLYCFKGFTQYRYFVEKQSFDVFNN